LPAGPIFPHRTGRNSHEGPKRRSYGRGMERVSIPLPAAHCIRFGTGFTNARLAEPYGGVGVGVGATVGVGAGVGVGVGAGVGVGPTAQPPVVQASQQLENSPTHAEPFFGALHCAAPFLVEHRVLPFLSVVQQVTNPGLPHVDFDAHETTLPLQLFGSSSSSASMFATPRAHFTYWP